MAFRGKRMYQILAILLGMSGLAIGAYVLGFNGTSAYVITSDTPLTWTDNLDDITVDVTSAATSEHDEIEVVNTNGEIVLDVAIVDTRVNSDSGNCDESGDIEDAWVIDREDLGYDQALTHGGTVTIPAGTHIIKHDTNVTIHACPGSFDSEITLSEP